MKKSFLIPLVVVLAIGLTITQLPAQTAMAESVETKLTASDGAGGDFFGLSVASSGDTAVVGAPFDNSGKELPPAIAGTMLKTSSSFTAVS